MSDGDVSTFRERANTAHRARVQSNAAELAMQAVDKPSTRRGRFFRSKKSTRTRKTATPAANAYVPAAYKANELNLSNEILLKAMEKVKSGESMDDVISGLLEAGNTENSRVVRTTTVAPALLRPARVNSSAANANFDRRKAAIRARAATVQQQRKSRAMTAAALGVRPGMARRVNSSEGASTRARPPRPLLPHRQHPPVPATVSESDETEAIPATSTSNLHVESGSGPPEVSTDKKEVKNDTSPVTAENPLAVDETCVAKLVPPPKPSLPKKYTQPKDLPTTETQVPQLGSQNVVSTDGQAKGVKLCIDGEVVSSPESPQSHTKSAPAAVDPSPPPPPPGAAPTPAELLATQPVATDPSTPPPPPPPGAAPTPAELLATASSTTVALSASSSEPALKDTQAREFAKTEPVPKESTNKFVEPSPPDADADAPLPKREAPPKPQKIQGNKFAALAAMLETRVQAASTPPVFSSGGNSSGDFPPLPPIPGSGSLPPPIPTVQATGKAPGKSATDLEDLSGDRNAAAYIEEKKRREQRAKAVKMLGVRALAERNRAASIARRQFENEMASMAGRLRKRNDDKFAKQAEVKEEEEDEDVSPALAAALAKVRAEKKAKEEEALQKVREAQVLAGDRSAAAFLEAKQEKQKQLQAKKKMSLKEQAELDRQAEEKRAAFEAEMKARSSNLKKQTTKTAMSVADMFAGADMSGVTKFADGDTKGEEDDGKSDFLKEIESSKRLKKAADSVDAVDSELFAGVNETDGDPRGQHALTIVRTTGKSITVRWAAWEGDKVSYALLKDGEMMTATEPGESPAATILPLEPKTTYRIKVIALGLEGIIGDEFAERNCSTAGVGQTWTNGTATSEAPKLAAKPADPPPPAPAVALSVLKSSPTAITLAWQPFGGTTVTESKRKCFCVMQDDDAVVITEQNDKTVAPIKDIQPGNHVFHVISLNFDGSPAAESEPLTLEFDGTTPPGIPALNDPSKITITGTENSSLDPSETETKSAPVVVTVSEVEPEIKWDGPEWAAEFAKMLRVGLPEPMVRMKMDAKGISAADCDAFFAAQSKSSVVAKTEVTSAEASILEKLDRRRATLSKTESYAAWEAKKQRRLSTAVQKRNIREKLFSDETTSVPHPNPADKVLSEAEAVFREALSEELSGLAIEVETLEGPQRAAFENRHLSVVMEKVEQLPQMTPVSLDEEEYIEDLNDLVDVADQLQLDEAQFDSLAAEMDYFDDRDIDELASEFDSIPEKEKAALFG